MSDLVAFGEFAGLKARKMKSVIAGIIDVVKQWTEFAEQAKVHDEHVAQIQRIFRVTEFDLP